MEIVSRAYNQFSHKPFGVIRKESDTERLQDEIEYYRSIQHDINKSILFPRLIASRIGTPNWFELERYGYNNVGYYLRNESDIEWAQFFNNVISILDYFSTILDPHQSQTSHLFREMVVKKTEREYNSFISQCPELNPLLTSKHIICNDNSYVNFQMMWPDIVLYINTEMLRYTSTMIHGDLCFSNILYEPTSNVVRLIDPRGSFGVRGIYGDQRYDIAKLYHSVDGGYECLINDDFYVNGFENEWRLEVIKQTSLVNAKSTFESMFFETGKYNKKHIKIIEGCIYIGMCARHYDSNDRQIAMYLTGIKLLNDALLL